MRLRQFDPFYYLLRYIILRKFFYSGLKKEEKMFVLDNINKHRGVLWINAIIIVDVIIALRDVVDNVDTLILALIAPVMVMGGAWFAITFGGIPIKLIDTAMSVTFWMFLAFSGSLSAMLVSVAYISPVVLWPTLVIIYLGGLFSCIQYDTADGLKAGLDEALFKHSRAAIRYYKKEGIEPEDDPGSGYRISGDEA